MMFVPLGDIAKVQSGFAFKSKDWRDSGIPVIKIQNVRAGQVTLDRCSYVSEETAEDARRYLLSSGDVLITMSGEIGSVGVVRVDRLVLLNQRVGRITPTSKDVDLRYLAFAIQDPKQKLRMESYAYGAAQPNISPALIEKLPIWLPETWVQERIAEILDSFDDLIENNRRRIEILEEMARLLYREWFVHFRFPGHEDVDLVNSDLGPIPEGWEIRSFAELADFVNGFAFKPEHWLDQGLPIVKIKELKNGVTSGTPRYHGADVSKKYYVGDGSVLFSWSADLKAYVWASGPALLNQHLFDVRPHEVSPLFIFHSLNERMDEFRARAQGTTMKHIKRSALGEVKIALPKNKLRDQFEGLVRPMLDLQLNLSKQNRALREARDLLLPRLVSGELDVSELDLDLVAV